MSKTITLFTICFLFFVYYSNAQEPKLILPIGHTYYVCSASFSPDGKKIVTASGDNTAKIWDAEWGIMLADLKGHTGELNSAFFSLMGKRL